MKTYIAYCLLVSFGLWYANTHGIDIYSSDSAAKRGMNQTQPHHK